VKSPAAPETGFALRSNKLSAGYQSGIHRSQPASALRASTDRHAIHIRSKLQGIPAKANKKLHMDCCMQLARKPNILIVSNPRRTINMVASQMEHYWKIPTGDIRNTDKIIRMPGRQYQLQTMHPY
jgi:hypothetical protein